MHRFVIVIVLFVALICLMAFIYVTEHYKDNTFVCYVIGNISGFCVAIVVAVSFAEKSDKE